MDRRMLTTVVCCHLTLIISGVGCCPFYNLRLLLMPEDWKWYNSLAPFSILFVRLIKETQKQIEMDAKMLGERLRQIRKRFGITQKQLAEITNLTQSVMSRLENGEEIYASALLSILYYYQGKINLDYLFSPEFNAESDRLQPSIMDSELKSFRHQLEIIADIITSSCETSLSQIEKLKRKCE